MVFTKHLIIILNYSQDHGSNENTMIGHIVIRVTQMIVKSS
jgi:hypothetical protein